MSPNRLEATITSNRFGSSTTAAASASISTCSALRSACCAVACANRSSQNGIVWMIPFDFVALQIRPLRVAGQLARVGDDPVGPAAGEDRLLHRQLVVGALVQPPADLRVLALDVLAHDHHVDVIGRQVAQGRGDAGEQLDRPQVHVLPELPADRDQQSPQRDVIRHVGPPDGAEQDRIALPQPLDRVRRHHPPGLHEVVAPPRVLGRLEREPMGAPGRLQHLECGGRDLSPDPVSGHDRDPMTSHGSSPIPLLRLPNSRAISSAGRAPPRQGGGHWFEPSIAHQKVRICGPFVSVVRDQFDPPLIRGSRLVRPPWLAWHARESTRWRRSISRCTGHRIVGYVRRDARATSGRARLIVS